MSRPATAATLSIAAGCGMASLAFIQSAPSGTSISSTRQVGATAPTVASSNSTSFSLSSAGAFAIAAASVAGAGSAARRQRRVIVAAEAPSVAERAIVEEDEEAPVPAEPPFDPSKQVGATLPLMYFDPAGLCKVGDKETFYNYRCAELKHGRVAMLAALGLVMQHNIKFPGFSDVPAGLGAVITPPGTFGLLVLVAAAGAVETQVWAQDPKKEPGNFGDPAGFGQYYDEWRNREINNGRMAMISTLAILVAELNTGKDGVEQIWQPLSNLPVE